MKDILEFAGDYWWLVFPVGGVVGGWFGGIAKYNEKRRSDKIELARIKASAHAEQTRTSQVTTRQLAGALELHDSVNERWFGYEIDLATLINFPLMTDMREPLTVAFHRAKVQADNLRPAGSDGLVDPEEFREYREAVHEYSVAFEAATREARRRKQSGFTPVEREALDRASKLVAIAADSAATAAERQLAYRKARSELDGLIDVPQVAVAQLERRIAGELEPGQ